MVAICWPIALFDCCTIRRIVGGTLFLVVIFAVDERFVAVLAAGAVHVQVVVVAKFTQLGQEQGQVWVFLLVFVKFSVLEFLVKSFKIVVLTNLLQLLRLIKPIPHVAFGAIAKNDEQENQETANSSQHFGATVIRFVCVFSGDHNRRFFLIFFYHFWKK